MYEIYNNLDNKITKNVYNVLYNIIIDNYFSRNKQLLLKRNEIDTKEAYNNWVNTICNTKGYNILVYYYENKIIGFISYMYNTKGLCLSEVQIKIEYQNKYNVLRSMLKILLREEKVGNSIIICGTINPNNIKSISVFSHIGMVNTEKKWYEISGENLLKWINKNM